MSTNQPGPSSTPPPPTYGSAGFLPKLEGAAREQALRESGPTWREWFFSSFLSIWLLLGFLTFDVWGVVQWLGASGATGSGGYVYLGILATLVGLSYLEFLMWRFLYYHPSREEDLAHLPFRSSWLVPVRFGLWTAEHRRLRQGDDPFDVTR
jgi:hypothetical protein